MFSRKERAEAKATKEELSKLIKPRPTFEQRQERKEEVLAKSKVAEKRTGIAAKRLNELHSGAGGGDVVQLGSQLLYLDALSDVQLKIQDHLLDSTRIVTRWTVYGKHDRDFLGMEPTGREVTFGGVTVSLLSDETIAQEFHYWDVVELLRQIQAP